MRITCLVIVCLLQRASNQDYVGIGILFIARGYVGLCWYWYFV